VIVAQRLGFRIRQAPLRNSMRVALLIVAWNIWHAADPFVRVFEGV